MKMETLLFISGSALMVHGSFKEVSGPIIIKLVNEWILWKRSKFSRRNSEAHFDLSDRSSAELSSGIVPMPRLTVSQVSSHSTPKINN